MDGRIEQHRAGFDQAVARVDRGVGIKADIRSAGTGLGERAKQVAFTATDLDNWAMVEAENPDLFANCYRFWVRRRA